MKYLCHSVSISYIWIMFINMRLMDKYFYSILFYSIQFQPSLLTVLNGRYTHGTSIVQYKSVSVCLSV